MGESWGNSGTVKYWRDITKQPSNCATFANTLLGTNSERSSVEDAPFLLQFDSLLFDVTSRLSFNPMFHSSVILQHPLSVPLSSEYVSLHFNTGRLWFYKLPTLTHESVHMKTVEKTLFQ